MYAAPHRDRERIDGLATFVAAAFLTALGLVAALARVGAPDRVVAALGPLIAVLGLITLGLVNRTARLGDFLAARRAIPPFYAGLALPATAAGLALAFGGEAADAFAPWPATAAGLVGAALIVGPLLRRANASAAADVLATRFPGRADPPPVRADHLRRRRADGGGRFRRRGRRARRGGQPQPPPRRDRDRDDAHRRRRPRRPQGPAVERRRQRRRRAGGRRDRRSAGVELRRRRRGAAAEWLAIPAEPNDAAFLLRSAAGALALAGFLPFAMPSLGAPQGEAQRAGGIALILALLAAALGAAASVGFAAGGRRRARRPRPRWSAQRRGCQQRRWRAPES